MTDAKTDSLTDYIRKTAQRRVDRVALRIERALRGLPPDEQGAILAHLLSLWLAGHIVSTELDQAERPQTEDLRDQLLKMHLLAVRAMMASAEARVLAKAPRDVMVPRPYNEPLN